MLLYGRMTTMYHVFQKARRNEGKYFCHKEVISESHMLAYTCNPTTQDVYTGEFPQVQD